MKKWPIVILLVLTGCATAPWTKQDGALNDERENYRVEIPENWMRSTQTKDFLITRDGALLQYISIQKTETGKPLKHSKKQFSENMLPQELAEVVQDDLASDPAVTEFQLAETRPATVCGFDGFRLLFLLKNKDGLRLKGVYCGFQNHTVVYGIRYQAAARYYFDKDLATFEQLVKTFKLI